MGYCGIHRRFRPGLKDPRRPKLRGLRSQRCISRRSGGGVVRRWWCASGWIGPKVRRFGSGGLWGALSAGRYHHPTLPARVPVAATQSNFPRVWPGAAPAPAVSIRHPRNPSPPLSREVLSAARRGGGIDPPRCTRAGAGSIPRSPRRASCGPGICGSTASIRSDRGGWNGDRLGGTGRYHSRRSECGIGRGSVPFRFRHCGAPPPTRGEAGYGSVPPPPGAGS
mmetsp:Transcript_47510/g.57181  ORF Transcript_47510/g.57181 Transcript_47510/m.57181 type:complete len:224 (-) Transcript_47510:468-1139(-)